MKKFWPIAFAVLSTVSIYIMLLMWGVHIAWGQDNPYTVRPTYNGSGSQVYEVWGSSDVFGPFMAKDLADDVAFGLNSAHRQRSEIEYPKCWDGKKEVPCIP
jgi:hypothetical protein